MGVINFLKEKMGVHRMFNDQNVGSHKMITDSVFILIKNTDFNTILACVGGKVYQWGKMGMGGREGRRIFDVQIERGVAILLMLTDKFGTPISKKIIAPLVDAEAFLRTVEKVASLRLVP